MSDIKYDLNRFVQDNVSARISAFVCLTFNIGYIMVYIYSITIARGSQPMALGLVPARQAF